MSISLLDQRTKSAPHLSARGASVSTEPSPSGRCPSSAAPRADLLCDTCVDTFGIMPRLVPKVVLDSYDRCIGFVVHYGTEANRLATMVRHWPEEFMRVKEDLSTVRANRAPPPVCFGKISSHHYIMAVDGRVTGRLQWSNNGLRSLLITTTKLMLFFSDPSLR